MNPDNRQLPRLQPSRRERFEKLTELAGLLEGFAFINSSYSEHVDVRSPNSVPDFTMPLLPFLCPPPGLDGRGQGMDLSE
jgi:hypothetical protein